jgi:hypothetical protein
MRLFRRFLRIHSRDIECDNFTATRFALNQSDELEASTSALDLPFFCLLTPFSFFRQSQEETDVDRSLFFAFFSMDRSQRGKKEKQVAQLQRLVNHHQNKREKQEQRSQKKEPKKNKNKK